jgi:hypothetical protein
MSEEIKNALYGMYCILYTLHIILNLRKFAKLEEFATINIDYFLSNNSSINQISAYLAK